ncbi:hypothetical protein HYH03_008426 [Edaphochlamys debaryana]|uniref:Uncharacterized protein n=1 Tax=Edaphochlamys debaryana TaxID=47281 RepID=A0A835Y073_9CHLO|nr:hypothetical protein HYH03_008426 [Edaphochlamys debaryana]|eukprot:KAG2493290.1 hypothetical protein HYH03_008426 [Edaphochlamys debaryana]
MGDMTLGSMDNLTGTRIKGTPFVNADKKLAHKAFPWCATAKDTAYFMSPSVTTGPISTSEYREYAFNIIERYGLCKDVLERKKKDNAVSTECATPFYSFMLAAAHNATEMYPHFQKARKNGVPLIKFWMVEPTKLTPAPNVVRSFTLSLRIYKHAGSTCTDLKTLCGGNTCLAALSDEKYETCPAFYSHLQ